MFLENLLKLFSKSKHDNSIILVIDDTPSDLSLVCSTIVRGGYNALKANKGASGLELAFKHKPDLIILDLNLPDMSGFEVCRRLKADIITREIPVMFLTVLDTPRVILDSYEQGAENYLLKPISGNLLLKQIEMILKDHQTADLAS